MNKRKYQFTWLWPFSLCLVYVVSAAINAHDFLKWFIELPEAKRGYIGIVMTVALAILGMCFDLFTEKRYQSTEDKLYTLSIFLGIIYWICVALWLVF